MWSHLPTPGNQMEGMCYLIGQPQSQTLNLQLHAALSQAVAPPAHPVSLREEVHVGSLTA